MSTLFDTETQLDRHDHSETEFTLSTASLLGIFFGLALVCGVFFGFGYSVGRRSNDAKSEIKSPSVNATDTVTNSNPEPATTAPATPKPSASQVLQSQDSSSRNSPSANPAAVPSTPVAAAAPAAQLKPAPALPEAASLRTPARAGVLPVAAPSPPETAYKPSAARISPAKMGAVEAVAASRAPAYGALPPASPPMTGTSNPSPSTVVQIAAVSHQEDADVLVAALKKRGYNVGIRHEPQDQLMHVQVGPFADRADAVAMRQKLLADGYNAIVKP